MHAIILISSIFNRDGECPLDAFLEELPLLEVARAWGLAVGVYQAPPDGALEATLPVRPSA